MWAKAGGSFEWKTWWSRAGSKHSQLSEMSLSLQVSQAEPRSIRYVQKTAGLSHRQWVLLIKTGQQSRPCHTLLFLREWNSPDAIYDFSLLYSKNAPWTLESSDAIILHLLDQEVCIHMGDWVEVLDKKEAMISPDPLYYLFTQQTLTQALLLGDLNPGDPVVSSRQKTCKVPTLMEFYWGDRQTREPNFRLTSV